MKKFLQNVINFIYQPYEFLKDSQVKFLYSVILPVIIFLILWFLGPFGLVLLPPIVKLKLILLINLSGSFIISIHFYLLQKYFIKKYNIGTTILWLLWIHLIIGLSNFLIYLTTIGNIKTLGYSFIYSINFDLANLPQMLLQTYLVGFLPTILILLYYNTISLKKKIKIVNQVNFTLFSQSKIIPEKNNLSISASNLREIITLDANSLVYINSQDNYVDIHWIENGYKKNSLIRNTLSKIDKDLLKQCNFIKRCHHSYIVNTNRIKSIDGNEAGYKIFLDGTEFPIPVSRKYKNSLLNHINR